MSELPNREEALNWLHGSAGSGYGRQFVTAYIYEDLKTEAEWRETINREAAAKVWHAEVGRRSGTNLTWDATYPDEQADFLEVASRAIDAALGDNND